MNVTTLIGLIAGVFTTLAFLPQVIKTWRTRSTEDLSAGTFTLFCTGVLLWLLYGILINDLPVILANSVTLLLVISMLVMIFVFRKRPNP